MKLLKIFCCIFGPSVLMSLYTLDFNYFKGIDLAIVYIILAVSDFGLALLIYKDVQNN